MGEFVNLGSFIIQFINICVIIFVLNKFLFKPYLIYLEQEEKKSLELDKAHEEMENAKKEAKKEAKTIIEGAKIDANTIKKSTLDLAKKESSNIISGAKDEAQKIKVKAGLDIENEKKILYSDLKDKVLDVALKINEKLFSKSESNKDFIEKSIKKEDL